MFWAVFFAAPALIHALPQVTPTRPPGSKDGGGGFSLIRFGCSQVVIERLDPYVSGLGTYSTMLANMLP